jgi:hypothetical protein
MPCAPDSTQVLPFDLGSAVESAHRLLSSRADTRLEALDGEGRHARTAEIDRARAYYREVLDWIERRRPNTDPDRVAALDARAEATHAEQTRRLAEIREKHQARWDITPYRLCPSWGGDQTLVAGKTGQLTGLTTWLHGRILARRQPSVAHFPYSPRCLGSRLARHW